MYMRKLLVMAIFLSLSVIYLNQALPAQAPKAPNKVTRRGRVKTVPKADVGSGNRVSSLQRNPPALGDMEVTIVAPGTSHNAILSVAAPKGDKRLLDQHAGMRFAGGEARFAAEKGRPGRLSARISFDGVAFAAEQRRRAELASQIKTIPLFAGREVVAREQIKFVDSAVIERAMFAAGKSNFAEAKIAIPSGVFDPIPTQIDPARELMITDTSVVMDQTRTFDVCPAAGKQGTPMGAWTFGKLMTDMANGKVDPAVMVENWLKTWETTPKINGWAVPARPKIDELVLKQWPRRVDGKLDLSKAPMRLLAIVNRVDLRNNNAYGRGDAGEGRFVFGVVDVAHCNDPTQFTVILEYGVPVSGCDAVHNWAKQWHSLGNIAFGAPFGDALQKITDQFAGPNLAPNKPAGSAINQVRTDEVALTLPWELREFHLAKGSGTAPPISLNEVEVGQTPDSSLMAENEVTKYIDDNALAILSPQPVGNPPILGAGGSYTVPQHFPGANHFLGASSINEQTVWTGTPEPLSNDARNNFSLGTCNACHGGETKTVAFTHVHPRAAGVESTLSAFLIGNEHGSSVANPTLETISDGHVMTVMRTYGDLLRREQGLDLLVSNGCNSGGKLAEFNFHPLNFTH